ncbi:MAG: NAD-dependent epimerase/dehydratase [Chlorobi bacterium]|nr:NAD-dependent epimerase/dehydratase [Chlorobiota bacterium]
MNILVTGGTGFTGIGVVPALLEAGHDLNLLCRPGSERKLPRHGRATPVTGNPLNADDVTRAIDGCDAVVHLVGVRREETRRTGLGYDDVDVASARIMAGAMTAKGVKRIILLSAGAIGNSHYVQCKGMAERAVIDAGLDWTIYRPSFILGPGQKWPIVLEPMLALAALIPGHIGDVARRARSVRREELAASMVRALGDPSSIGEIYDVPRIRATGR